MSLSLPAAVPTQRAEPGTTYVFPQWHFKAFVALFSSVLPTYQSSLNRLVPRTRIPFSVLKQDFLWYLSYSTQDCYLPPVKLPLFAQAQLRLLKRAAGLQTAEEWWGFQPWSPQRAFEKQATCRRRVCLCKRWNVHIKCSSSGGVTALWCQGLKNVHRAGSTSSSADLMFPLFYKFQS